VLALLRTRRERPSRGSCNSLNEITASHRLPKA
jgi:hypothetical protein